MKNKMKNKNLLNEFKDPYQKNSTNFAPASVSSGPERAPTPAEVQDIFDPKKPPFDIASEALSD